MIFRVANGSQRERDAATKQSEEREEWRANVLLRIFIPNRKSFYLNKIFFLVA